MSFLSTLAAAALCVSPPSYEEAVCGKILPFKNVTLEMSLKPFKQTDDAYLRSVAQEAFRQWDALTRHADMVSVLLWTADGSEILDYAGDLTTPLEWARYIGGANKTPPANIAPEALSLHETKYLYMENPPVITYGDLKRIVAVLREVGGSATGKPVRVGATFDPGPEFAESPFKYQRHPEVCMGNTMGKGTFVCCYATLNADDRAYAGFPDGIPQDTPFGRFFGRQSQHFLADLGFDYIWFSNGVGFGVETWGVTGAVFDGKRFDTAAIGPVRDKILQFWTLFREECPEFPIETRGTNLSTGIDLSADGVPLRSIYSGGFNLMPPPNSPWAALDGDFGLELVGYMSHIAAIPAEDYPFRYYTHDPWWLNSPWLDRYGREPHDIHLPMSVARIDGAGNVCPPSWLDFLTIDNSYGNMPVQVPNEVIPHILRNRANPPDQPGPVVWVYPFDEYHDMVFGNAPRVEEVFFGDWFMRQAVNSGFPVNTVVSSKNALSALEARPALFSESVLVAPVPDAATPLNATLLNHVARGGRVLLYGPIASCGDDLLAALNLARAEPLHGELPLDLRVNPDRLEQGAYPETIVHRPLMCAGGMAAVLADPNDPATRIAALAGPEQDRRVAALSRSLPEWQGGVLAWVRGTNASDYTGGRLLKPDDPNQWFISPLLMRYMLGAFGYAFGVDKVAPGQRDPLVCVTRSRNAFVFAGYNPDTTVTQRFRFPQGAPLFIEHETRLKDGHSAYSMPRGWRRECRIFVEQEDGGVISCREQPSGQYGVSRRLEVHNLKNALVRIYPDPAFRATLRAYVNTAYPYRSGQVEALPGPAELGDCVELADVTGKLTVSW